MQGLQSTARGRKEKNHGQLNRLVVRVDLRRREGREEFILLIGSAFCTPCPVKCCAIFNKVFRKKQSIIKVHPLISLMALPLNCARQICAATLRKKRK